jgi:hypothetical protein
MWYDPYVRRIPMRFDGWIAGIGTTSGTRVVLGHWLRSPFGPVSDLMIEDPDGVRLLLAGTPELASFVAGTYQFDEVRPVPVQVRRAGPDWRVDAGPYAIEFRTGRRGWLGSLLRAVPPPIAASRAWLRAIDAPARLILAGVRTHGSAGGGRHEWYGVRDRHRIISAGVRRDGHDLGELADVQPAVRFGFGSTPRVPALMRVTTTVDQPA